MNITNYSATCATIDTRCDVVYPLDILHAQMGTGAGTTRHGTGGTHAGYQHLSEIQDRIPQVPVVARTAQQTNPSADPS